MGYTVRNYTGSLGSITRSRIGNISNYLKGAARRALSFFVYKKNKKPNGSYDLVVCINRGVTGTRYLDQQRQPPSPVSVSSDLERL